MAKLSEAKVLPKEVRTGYRATEKQRLFHMSPADEVLFGGAAGGGKSLAVIMDALARCLKYRGTTAYIFRRTYREVEDSLMPLARRFIPEGVGRYDGDKHEYRFPNGSAMRFRHCRSDADMYRYQGSEIQWLYFDELTHFTKGIYDFLKSRLRAAADLGVKPKVRCTSNPGGVGHAWVKTYFVDGGEPFAVRENRVFSETLGEWQVSTVQYIPAYVTDNPHISREYVFELERKPPALRQALLFGSWSSFEGQAFGEFRDDERHYADRRFTHVISPFAMPAHWPRYRSFDFGYARPFSVLWWAVGDDGEVYLYREWYGAKAPDEGLRLTAREIARGIREAEAGEKIVAGYADPSIWDGSRGESIAEQMEKEGVFFIPGENARVAGKMQMHYRLAFDGEGRAGMYVFSTCREFIRCLPSLVYDPARPEDIDTRGEDHSYDAARYFLMSRPVGRTILTPRKKAFNPLETEKRERKGFLEA